MTPRRCGPCCEHPADQPHRLDTPGADSIPKASIPWSTIDDAAVTRTTSRDGTEIVGRVHGQGPPLVLVHGAFTDGPAEWGELVPLLADPFTCYLPDLRGRGLSGDHPDQSREAHVQDVVAFVESIGRAVGLVGVSNGAMLALGAAARTDTVAALAAFERGVIEAADQDTMARLQETCDNTSTALWKRRPDERERDRVGRRGTARRTRGPEVGRQPAGGT